VVRPLRNRANKHLQDRAAMRAGNWSGIVGVNPQDFAVAEGMGPILDRSREHLGATDVAIIRYRRACSRQRAHWRLATSRRGLVRFRVCALKNCWCLLKVHGRTCPLRRTR
jgi:hypothetical protein